IPGNPDDSELLRRVTADDGSEMPPEGPRLKAAEIALLRRWIDGGAQFPAEELIDDPRQHWSFRPVVRPAVPQISGRHRPLNPIDAFIAAAHAQHGLTPNSPA